MDLQELRKQMDETDTALVELFCRRMQISGEIAQYKAAHDLPILQPGREEQVLERVSRQAGEELADYARELYATLMRLSRAYQSELLSR